MNGCLVSDNDKQLPAARLSEQHIAWVERGTERETKWRQRRKAAKRGTLWVSRQLHRVGAILPLLTKMATAAAVITLVLDKAGLIDITTWPQTLVNILNYLGS